jgi:hypothetical protein
MPAQSASQGNCAPYRDLTRMKKRAAWGRGRRLEVVGVGHVGVGLSVGCRCVFRHHHCSWGREYGREGCTENASAGAATSRSNAADQGIGRRERIAVIGPVPMWVQWNDTRNWTPKAGLEPSHARPRFRYHRWII